MTAIRQSALGFTFHWLGAVALVATVVGLASWSAAASLPGGALYAGLDLALLHAVAVLPLAYASARWLRGRVALARATVGVVAAIIVLAGAAALFRPGAIEVQTVYGWPLWQQMLARSVLAFCLQMPGVSLLAHLYERLTRAPAEPREGPIEVALRGLLVIGVAVAVPLWVHPQQLDATADRAINLDHRGYVVGARDLVVRLGQMGGETAEQRAGRQQILARLQQQVAILEQQATLEPNGLRDRITRIRALVSLGRYDAAEREIGGDGEHGYLLREVGRIAIARGDHRAAFDGFAREVGFWRLALARQPGEALRGELGDALAWQGRAALAGRRFREAAAVLDEALAIRESAEEHMLTASAMSALGRGDDALAHLARAVELDPARAGQATSVRRVVMEKSSSCLVLAPAFRGEE